MFRIELVWNREFHFIPYGDVKDNIEDAKSYASELKSMGNGERVKKVRVINNDTDEIVLNSHEIPYI